jgi:NADH-quinone oxidoreductase subunit C
MSSTAESIAAIKAKFSVSKTVEFRGETTVYIDRSDIHDICKLAKTELGFDYLIDITSIDNFGVEPRYDIVYELYSMAAGQHLRLKLSVSEDELEVPTVVPVWATANWHEREIYDMMGIKFTGHPDLRRIIMWEGYPFHPLRKDFPLAGKPSDMPDVAFSAAAPLAGGPFVTLPSPDTTEEREPRSRSMD